MSTLTPMMRQYLQVKEQYKDAILFYRLGDFYEMFFDDAEKASRLLNLTLTSRNKNQEGSVPLCGVPYHSAQGYINKLVSLGHKVAVCEQTEDPAAAKGIVKREVVQVITPGLVLDPESLEGRSQNHLLALVMEQGRFGLAVIDISTGSFRVSEFDNEKEVESELARVEPSEILVLESQKRHPWFEKLPLLIKGVRVSFVYQAYNDIDFVADIYRDYYKAPVEGLGLESCVLAMKAGAMVLSYLADTKLLQDQILSRPSLYWASESLILDASAKRNLELTKTLSDHSTKGSLFWLLDKTQTPMGSRTLRQWMLYPLLDKARIEERLSAVEELKNNPDLMDQLKQALSSIGDLERIQNRVLAGLAHARDLLGLQNSLFPVPEIKEILRSCRSLRLKDIGVDCTGLPDLCSLIQKTLVEDPPLALKEGGLIREGVDATLDELKELEKNGKSHLASMETREREATGIPSLKIRFNRVFGYSIEITHTHQAKIPPHYIRKQTLTQAERYITPELKEYEEKILGASEKMMSLEYVIFLKLREEVIRHSEEIKKTAKILGELDALLSLAFLAREQRYVRPEIVEEPVLDLVKGRHPIVEKLFREEPFIPNNVFLNTEEHRLMMITGPNMAGKSTVMRQVALIVLMAQMGGFVPAESARIGIVDRIFTRIGASDHLQKGQSTFMVEMLETSQILSQATQRSLVILDEIGRGTSTFDGLSIAWSVAETLHDQIRARTLFATHYHELTDLAEKKTGIKNFHMAVKEWNDEIIFLRELVAGGTNHSYGVFVAAMAGLPPKTIARAREILKILEEKDWQFKAATLQMPVMQPSLFEKKEHPVVEKIRKTDVNCLTPLEALNLFSKLKEEVK